MTRSLLGGVCGGNKVNDDRDTPLSVAVKCETEAMVGLFVRHDVKVRDQDLAKGHKLDKPNIVVALAKARQTHEQGTNFSHHLLVNNS
ncbi:hypothetical protein LTR70_007543, partial [Exophiala xenobiotica]